jgi:uncharacterized repeat protein (TIGR01451 family)
MLPAGCKGPTRAPQFTREPNIQELKQLQEALNTTDLGITIAGAPDRVTAGGLLTYTLTAYDVGPNPAIQVQVSLTLPADVTYQRDTDGCGQESPSTLTCSLGEILARQNRQFSVNVLVDAGRAAGALVTTATVSNLAGPDPKPENNRATEETQVTR